MSLTFILSWFNRFICSLLKPEVNTSSIHLSVIILRGPTSCLSLCKKKTKKTSDASWSNFKDQQGTLTKLQTSYTTAASPLTYLIFTSFHPDQKEASNSENPWQVFVYYICKTKMERGKLLTTGPFFNITCINIL